MQKKGKLLFLGGAYSQVPAIIRAKKLGYYVITCDYLPDNPGHAYSDQYVNISTVNKDAVLEFAKKEDIQGIIAYASDPSASSAAYVCDELQLPGAGYNITRMFCEKDLFRIFQKEHGFLTPWFISLESFEECEEQLDSIKFPCVVKPVDSSGSKGVTVVYSEKKIYDAVKKAFCYTRCKRIIIEQYISSPHMQLHGDGIVNKGKLQFIALGDQRFKNSVPIGSSLPSKMDEKIMKKAIAEVARCIELSGFQCGGINVEIRVTDTGDIYILEIGPRTGGNYVPQLMELATGFDEMSASLQLSMGEECSILFSEVQRCCFQYIVGSKERGYFQEIYIDEYIKKKVVKKYIHKSSGDLVEDYENSSGVVGVVLLKFDTMQEMEKDIKEIDKHIKVIVKGENI